MLFCPLPIRGNGKRAKKQVVLTLHDAIVAGMGITYSCDCLVLGMEHIIFHVHLYGGLLTRSKNIWLFNAGNAFSGNPKWLFLYIQKNHPEIECHWLCYRKDLVRRMRELGYSAFLFKSRMAKYVGTKAGVYVVDQNKEVYQPYLSGITVLNLWHGVGCKSIEHALAGGFMDEGIVRKHIVNESVYRQQLFLVTSPTMEKHFVDQCRLSDRQLVRAGYPSSFADVSVQTFDHDIRRAKGLTRQTRVAVYAPTYRDVGKEGFFAKALPSFDRLVSALKQNDWLLVLKAHPQVESDLNFKALKRQYESSPRLLFWDNANDFYEVMDQVDLAIVDYSSIFYDLLAHGVRQFVRYVFDYGDEQLRDFALDYMENTCGKVCKSFDSLLEALADPKPSDQAEVDRIFDTFWEYSKTTTTEDIVQRALMYEPSESAKLPTLYSFDVFDTLIGRTTTNDQGAFLYVQDKMRQTGGFPRYLQDNYRIARAGAEGNCRQYVLRTMDEREDDRTEISFDMIFKRLGDLFDLTPDQLDLLRAWELEGERRATRPIPENINRIRNLVAHGEDVLLISDMYLPESFVKELLKSADPFLADLPLFLSSTTGKQKTRKGLFLEAYHSLDYNYQSWIHVGDDPIADVKRPRALGITTRPCSSTMKIDEYCNELRNWAPSFDIDRVAALIARFKYCNNDRSEEFAYAYASLYFVPYVYWAIDHALSRGVECLYFISRDGHHLKRIADAIIETRKLELETRYIYGSRRAWRVPSQADEVDDAFFSYYGNFTGVEDYESLLHAARMDNSQFEKMLPQLTCLKNAEPFSTNQLKHIVQTLSNSVDYRSFLMEAAKAEREPVLRYLRQEIDFSKKFAFVEYWGRGYTQSCLTKLLKAADSRVAKTEFYYARSIMPTQGDDVRYNLTASNVPMLFIEAQFANMPYSSIEGYKEHDGKMEPVMQPFECNKKAFESYEEWLPRFARDFASIDFVDAESTMRELLEFALRYFADHQTDEHYLTGVAPLKDSPTIQAEPIEYAPAWTIPAVIRWARGEKFKTSNKAMSVARSGLTMQLAQKGYQAVKHVKKEPGTKR